jgi:nitronate monooxygenase/enoyl-[acyl-carrier protein] reductase II
MALRTPLIDRLEAEPASVDPTEIAPRLVAEVRANRGHDLVPFTGQSAGLVHDVAPAAEIVSRLVAGARAALDEAAASLASSPDGRR